jgi:hypothetical protein
MLTAHGFQSRRPRALLTGLNYCRIRVKYPNSSESNENAGKVMHFVPTWFGGETQMKRKKEKQILGKASG